MLWKILEAQQALIVLELKPELERTSDGASLFGFSVSFHS